MATVTDFQQFNVFGVVRASSGKVFATGTAVLADGHSVERSAKVEEKGILPQLSDDDPAVILFSAHLTPDKKSRVYTQNLAARSGGVDLSKNEVIANVIHNLMKEFWK